MTTQSRFQSIYLGRFPWDRLVRNCFSTSLLLLNNFLDKIHKESPLNYDPKNKEYHS